MNLDKFAAVDWDMRESEWGFAGLRNTAYCLGTFHLERDGATWKAKMSHLAKPKPGAKDARGGRINFGLVDVDVAPDGSLLISDHNQGIWRIFYDAKSKPAIPPIVPQLKNSDSKATAIDTLLPESFLISSSLSSTLASSFGSLASQSF